MMSAASPGDRRQHVGLMVVVLDEPEAEDCADALASNHPVPISAATVAVALIVVQGCNARAEMATLLDGLGLEIGLLGPAAVRRAANAYARWGRGFHTAALNFGDRFAYALANSSQRPLHFGTGAGQHGSPSASEREGGRLTDGPRMACGGTRAGDMPGEAAGSAPLPGFNPRAGLGHLPVCVAGKPRGQCFGRAGTSRLL